MRSDLAEKGLEDLHRARGKIQVRVKLFLMRLLRLPPAQHAYHAETLTLRVVSRNASIALVHCTRSVHDNALNAWMMLDGVRHVISFT